jgi:antitoxin component YwqK of YwqJK toxin-antitoxin module
MKPVGSLLAALILACSAWAQNRVYVIGDTAIMSKGWKPGVSSYKPFKDKLKDGHYAIFTDPEKKKVAYEFFVSNGTFDSTWLEYYSSGSRKGMRTYRNGKLNGKQVSWYESGGRKDSSIFVDNNMLGTYCKWHENGILAERKLQGTRNVGDWVVWDKNGRPEWIYINDFKRLRRTEITWHENGQVKSLKQLRFKPHVQEEEVKKEGNWETFDAVNYSYSTNFSEFGYEWPEGKKAVKKDSVWITESGDKTERLPKFQCLMNGDGKHFTWSREGRLLSYEEYSGGKANGKFIKWNDKGIKLEEGSFKVITEGKFKAMSKKDGKWLYWHYDGKPHKEEIYENGELKEEKYF